MGIFPIEQRLIGIRKQKMCMQVGTLVPFVLY